MSLTGYGLASPSTVILDDDRDPHVSWRNHLARAGRGGVDIVAAVGTPIYARTDGVMDWRKNDGTAGDSSRFWHKHNAGWADVFSHLSEYVGKDMQAFKAGDLIAYSGNSGGVTQHLHWHLLDPNGVRRNPWDHFSASTASGGKLTPIIPLPDVKDDDMSTIFYQPTSNSSPQKDGTSRIWAGRRTIGVIDYSDIWGIADNGEGRRLTRKHWVDLYAEATKRGITLPVVQCTGNELEQIMYGPRL